ncbi:MAG TPA: peptidylprolyl isomerase [Bacteroidales bacterium]|nr:peptidylprolyl isomerase [Bacteroidales bacterium]
MKLIYTLLAVLILSFNLMAQSSPETRVLIKTSYGNIVVKLYNDTPLHRDNFIKLVKDGYYDGLLFHRVIQNFMIQGGDPNSRNAARGEMLGMGGPGYTIPAEIIPGHFHKKGALAAARKGDAVNPKKASSGSQFYIIQGQVLNEQQLQTYVSMGNHAPFTPEEVSAYTTIGGSPHLDGEYTVFGEVVEGLDVIDKIAAVAVDAYNRPVEDISYTIEIMK